MKEFNENPFKKDTPVVPFSNGTEYQYWSENIVTGKQIGRAHV